jgi:hypothetical protein
MLIIMILASYFVVKGVQKQQAAAITSSSQAAIAVAGDAVALSGTAPTNGNPANPGSSQAGGVGLSVGDDDSDGAMSDTVLAVAAASNDTVGSFDMNETQSASGMDNAGSGAWRPPLAGLKWNRVLLETWEDVLDCDYISAQPSTQFPFIPPGMPRQDNNPNLNRQPWARNQSFQATDPSQYFDADSDGVPAVTNDTDGDTLDD